MPISVAALVVGKEQISIPFGEDTLNLTYDPNKFTVELERRLKEAQTDEGSIAASAELLAELIVQWDVLDEKDKPLPVNAQTIGALGLGVMGIITRAIGDNQNPNARDASSANGSRRTAASARARNGTH